MSIFKRLIKAPPRPIAKPEFKSAIAPDSPFHVIGDVHGCLQKMQSLISQIKADHPGEPIILVGDYIDRGEDSAGVLRALFALRDDPDIVCLQGNHEEMFLKFLDYPESKGVRWIQNGGLQTIASFGIGGVGLGASVAALVESAAKVSNAIGPEMLEWLRQLPLIWRNGNIAAVHAGADPNLPIDRQPDSALKWGHAEFETSMRFDGLWIAHGHTIVAEPYAKDGRIAVDTGGYATGRLTAARISTGGVTFLTV